MAVFKCKMCGGALEIAEGTTTCECSYCGTVQTLPKLNDDKKTNLYDRANHFRRNNDFDKAMGVYEQILNEDTTDAEAYWSLVLCQYGIEYVDDPATHKKVPTVNRAQYTSIFADENYKAALKYADANQKNIYEAEAKQIDEIQMGILEISQKEEPFDVFICYKETDNNGRRTQDSVLANDLYHQLLQEGFKVFFSRITLEDKLGVAYEPYIFAALNSAKVMVVLGTKPEYFKAVWVKNEWARYLALIRGGAKKMLIPAYKDMDPYDLPEEFSHLQAQDMSKLGFMQDLIRGIKKIIGADQPQTVTKETVVVQQGGAAGNSNVLIKRGNMALEDSEWQKADEFFEEALNQDAECAEAYLGKLLSKCKRSSISSLTQYYISKYEEVESEKLVACPEATSRIDDAISSYMILDFFKDAEIKKQYVFNRTYISELSFRKQQKSQELAELSAEKLLARSQQYATGETKNLIEKMIEDITNVLDRRIAVAKQADDEQISSITNAYEMHLNDADIKVKELYNKALERQESTYNSRVNQMNQAKSVSDYEKVRDLFIGMYGYKDANALADKCQTEIDRLKEKEHLEAESMEAARRKEAVRRSKKKISIAIIVATIAVAVIVVYYVVIPNNKYNNAVALFDSGKYQDAIDILAEIDGYKNADILKGRAEINIIAGASIGDNVTFGNYIGNTEWEILAKEDEKVLVISKYALVRAPYNRGYAPVTWESCTLRAWLNGTYLTSAFNSYEQAMIMSTNVENTNNAKYGTVGGNNTTDKVFLLSIDEAEKYFSSNSDRAATFSDGTSVTWWLRSPGKNSNCAVNILGDHNIYENGDFGEDGVDRDHVAVRPAMWIDISNF